MDLPDTQKGCYNGTMKGRVNLAKRTRYNDEYKKEIVRLVTELGKKPSEVANDIGVTDVTVRRWVKQFNLHGDDAFPGKGNLRPADAKERELQKEIQDLKEENAILKKAMAIFSRDVK